MSHPSIGNRSLFATKAKLIAILTTTIIAAALLVVVNLDSLGLLVRLPFGPSPIDFKALDFVKASLVLGEPNNENAITQNDIPNQISLNTFPAIYQYGLRLSAYNKPKECIL
jgi:hypothetical protein